MRNKLLITITTLKGSKQYTISQLIKRFLITFILMIFIFLAISVVTIKYLKSEVENQSKTIKKLKETKFFLEKSNKDLKNKIEYKEKILNQINDKIADIEDIINFTPPKDVDSFKRLELAKLDLIDKKLILRAIPNGSPVGTMVVTSPFGWRINPMLHKKEFHRGIDLRAKFGSKVYAPADGVVEFANYHKSSGYGNLLIIDHNFGFKTLYGHLSKILVKRGEFVKKGDLVALTGNSGLSNGPHLHYEIRYLNIALNPKYFLNWNLKNYDKIFKKEKRVDWLSLIEAVKWQKKYIEKLKE